MSNLLEVRSLHTLYGDSHVLHGVSFDIQQGQAVSPSVTKRALERHAVRKGASL
jgi:ABC-type histidine transport system ATPase subunit